MSPSNEFIKALHRITYHRYRWSSFSQRILKYFTLARRSRFPYCFKHHTVSFLTGLSFIFYNVVHPYCKSIFWQRNYYLSMIYSELDNRLISTDVLFGKSSDSARRRLSNSKLLVFRLVSDILLVPISMLISFTLFIYRNFLYSPVDTFNS